MVQCIERSLDGFIIGHKPKYDTSVAFVRAAVAVDMLPLLEQEARERQRLAAEKTNASKVNSSTDALIQKVVQAKGTQNHEGLAATKAAKLMGTNRLVYLWMCRKLLDDVEV
jgi:hypothetical protein